MSYATIDPIINIWILQNKLVLLKSYQDCEVRSVELVDKKGERYQIWVEEPQENNIRICAWDFKKRKIEFTAEKSDLLQKLNKALSTVRKWM
jgi:hypothetical protein